MQSKRAIHSRFFGVYYRTPKRSNVFAGIEVSIFIVSAVCTLKRFITSFTNMFAYGASLARICRFNNNQRHAIKQRFKSQKLTKLVETPTVQLCLLCLTLWLCSKPNLAQILNSYTLVFFFGFSYYLFADCMVINRNEPAFSTTKPFQEFFTSFSVFALNACSYFRIFFTNFFNSKQL